MADDALDQVLAQVLALADPDAQAAIGGTHQHPAPFAPVLEHLVQAFRRHLGQLRRIAGAGQQPAIGGPDLEGQLILVGMRRHAAGNGLHGPIEHPDQLRPTIRRRRAGLQQAFQQARALDQLGVVDALDLAMAVAQRQQSQGQTASQHQGQGGGEDAGADGDHGWRSSR